MAVQNISDPHLLMFINFFETQSVGRNNNCKNHLVCQRKTSSVQKKPIFHRASPRGERKLKPISFLPFSWFYPFLYQENLSFSYFCRIFCMPCTKNFKAYKFFNFLIKRLSLNAWWRKSYLYKTDSFVTQHPLKWSKQRLKWFRTFRTTLSSLSTVSAIVQREEIRRHKKIFFPFFSWVSSFFQTFLLVSGF